MSMSDPIADMLTRIRNAQMAEKSKVKMPFSNVKRAIAQVLIDEGYIESMTVIGHEQKKPELELALKYYAGRPVIEKLNESVDPGCVFIKARRTSQLL